VQTISIVVAATGVLIAAINSIYSSRRAEEQRQLTLETQQHALETRQAQLFMQVYNRWNSRDLTRSYGAIRYKFTSEDWIEYLDKTLLRGKADPNLDLDYYVDHQILGTFFEGLGILVKKKLVDINLVEDLFSGRIMWYWETQLGPAADLVRSRQKDSTLYDSIDYLYNTMKQRQQTPAVT
jgi:hypothetical protein